MNAPFIFVQIIGIWQATPARNVQIFRRSVAAFLLIFSRKPYEYPPQPGRKRRPA